MTTVLIVDDLGSIREFLKINLSCEPDIQVVGLADNGYRAIAQVEEHQPDIVLMDIDMPGSIDGIQATAKIAQRFPNTKVLLLTSQDDNQQLNRALKAGSRGYILKNTSVKDIANIIRLTKKGFFQIGPILGSWDGTLHNNLHSSARTWEANQINDHATAIVKQDFKYPHNSTKVFNDSHVISNLTSGLFQLQETIKSQEDTIVDLTNKYSQVQQEIRAKLTRDKRVLNTFRANSYGLKMASRTRTQKQQHLFFIISFFLGVLTVIFLMFLIMILGKGI